MDAVLTHTAPGHSPHIESFYELLLITLLLMFVVVFFLLMILLSNVVNCKILFVIKGHFIDSR